MRMLAFMLFCQTFFACQQLPEKAFPSADNILFQTVFASQQHPETTPLPATNILFKSEDGGQTWQDVSAGLPKDLPVARVLADGNDIILCTRNALYQSNTAAAAPNWEEELFWDVEMSNIFPGRNGLYISSYGHGLFQKIPGSNVLLPMHNTLKDKTVRSVLETPDGTVFVGCESGLFKSADNGRTWKQVFSESGVNSLAAAEGALVCGTYKGLLRSTDGGEHWDWVLTEDGSAFKTAFHAGCFVTITQGGKAWHDGVPNRLRFSTDSGKSWQRMDESLAWARLGCAKDINLAPIQDIYDIKQAGQYLFCSCNAGIFRSSDGGKNWEPVFANKDKRMFELAVSGNVVYAIPVVGC